MILREPTTLASVLAERGYVACRCGAARKRTAGPWGCGRPKCEDRGAGGSGGGQKQTPSKLGGHQSHSNGKSKPRAGKAAEDALADLLAGPFIVEPFAVWLRNPRPEVFVREFPVGLMLEPPRRYRADFYAPAWRLCVEVEGGAHGVQRQRRSDIVREQLLEAAGLRVVRVLPEQVHDGSALEVIRRAVEGTR